MEAKYLSTKLATDWPEMTGGRKTFIERILFFVPRANPSYDLVLHHVRRWLIEFEDGIQPGREIGLDAQNTPVLFGPSGNDYGFWLDTNMKYENFEGDPISQDEFEDFWRRAQCANKIQAEPIADGNRP